MSTRPPIVSTGRPRIPVVTAALALALLVMPPLAPARAQQAPPRAGDDLVGLWGAEAITGPAVRGELILERAADGWVLSVGGYRVRGARTGDSLNLSLPGEIGRLRASGLQLGRLARAYWIRPSARGYDFAMPVVLEPAGPTAWRGALAPFDDRFALYLLVRREADGTLSGIFRNPDFGWNLGRRFKVARAGDNVTLTDPASGRVRFTQAYDSGQRTIAFDFGTPILLRPRGRDDAPGFWPLSPADPAPAYGAPVLMGDGWQVGAAAAVGLDESVLGALITRIATADPVNDSVPLVHSVLVARRGTLVLERYFRGFTADRLHDTRSAFKTMTSILAGIAMQQGTAIAPSTPVYATLRPGQPLDDARKANIRLRQLFTHSTGLACDDNDEKSPGQEDRMQEQSAERDWTRYALNLPVARDTGAVYAYCSATMNLAGSMVSALTKRWLPAYFDEQLARPLGITHWAWNLTPTGEGYGGGGANLRSRDLLKFGQLYLNGGTWHGRRLIPAAWIRESTAHQITTSGGGSDGYAWHRNTLRANGREYAEYEMSGNGGQLVMVVPAADLVVVFTAGSYQRYAAWRTLRDELLPRYILGAIR